MLLHQVWQKSLFARLNLINTQPLIGPNMFLALFDWQSGLIHLVGSHHTVGLLFCSSLSLHLHVPPTGGWERWKWCGWKTAASEEAERWSRWQKESRTGGGREEAQQPKERYLPFFTTFPKHTTLLPSVSAVQTPIPSCFVINICWSNFLYVQFAMNKILCKIWTRLLLVDFVVFFVLDWLTSSGIVQLVRFSRTGCPNAFCGLNSVSVKFHIIVWRVSSEIFWCKIIDPQDGR